MRFETSQHMKLGQHMKLAPRMIQSMEILAMPLTELEERIDLELGSNPTLELVEHDMDADELRKLQQERDADTEAIRGEMDHDQSGSDDFARLDAFEHDNPDAAGNAFDDDHAAGASLDTSDRSSDPRDTHDMWEPGSRASSRIDGEPDAKMDAMSNAPARLGSLADQLLAQWGLVEVDPALRPLGEIIIAFLDEDGYLRTPLDEVADKAPRQQHDSDAWPPPAERWELALKAVQIFLEPAGVAARDARECLLLQIDAALAGDLRVDVSAGAGDEAATIAPHDVLVNVRRLIADHLTDLMNNRLPKIAEKSGLELPEIKRAIEAMRRLSLAPARRL
ncbi:MAG: hypothetical protein AAF235_12235, partial [Planctomycetota bacterium]